MCDSQVLAELPATYRRLLTLLRAGASRADIAAALAVEDDAVDGLVRVAEAKLAAACARAGAPGPPSTVADGET